MIRVLIADDHLLIREGLKRILKDESQIKIVGECENALEIFNFLEKNECDMLILDINLPDKNGMEVLNSLRSTSPDLKVLILSVSPEERYATKFLKAGAMGYLSKNAAADQLVNAVIKTASGKKYVSPELGEKLIAGTGFKKNKSPESLLSGRELQVMELLARGKSQVEIANKLTLSPSSVNTYRSRILNKLNLNSNADIIRYAIDNNLYE